LVPHTAARDRLGHGKTGLNFAQGNIERARNRSRR
jgi:hypothetical protein